VLRFLLDEQARRGLTRVIRCRRVLALIVVLAFTAQCGGSSAPPTTPTPPVTNPPQPPDPPPPPPPPGPDAVFVGAGDIAMCNERGAELTARVLDRIQGTVFTLGDNAYPAGTARDFAECYEPTWGRHKARTRPIPGNHDFQTERGAPYFNYFGQSAGQPGLGYYMYRVGTWNIYALNSNIAVNGVSTQATWLQQQLSDNPSRCAAALLHHPLFSSGQNGDHAFVRDLYRILYGGGVDIILAGHDHTYERFSGLINPDGGSDPKGFRHFIVGTGGASLYQFRNVKPFSAMRHSGWGVLKLTLKAQAYDWEFVPVDGDTFRDMGSGVCQ
jgi:hypothetical protein